MNYIKKIQYNTSTISNKLDIIKSMNNFWTMSVANIVNNIKVKNRVILSHNNKSRSSYSTYSKKSRHFDYIFHNIFETMTRE